MSRRIILLDLPWTRDKDPRVPLGHASLLACLRARTNADLRSLVIPRNGPECTIDSLASRILSNSDTDEKDVDLAIGVYVWCERGGRAAPRRLHPL